MKKIFAAAAALTIIGGGAYYLTTQQGNTPANDITQTDIGAQPQPPAPRQEPAAPPAQELSPEERSAQIRSAVDIKSVTAAYSLPEAAAELNAALEISGDDLDNNGFLALTYTVTTDMGMIREVDALAYCNEFLGSRSYNSECAEEIAWSIARTNSAYNGPLEQHVATDNAELRENALTSVRWLRTAVDSQGNNTNLLLVRDIRDMASVTGLSPDAFIPEPEEEEAFPDKKERILSSVALHSVTPAMSDPDTHAELTAAFEAEPDNLTPSGFLNMSFHVATREGTLENVDILAYCEEFIGNRNYNNECVEAIRLKVAAVNSTAAFGLAAHFPTDNPQIRENALVSVGWLRRALENTSYDNSYYVVRELNTLMGPR